METPPDAAEQTQQSQTDGKNRQMLPNHRQLNKHMST
jgi:hypothetical protein